MRKRLFRSLFVVALLVFAACFVLIFGVLYQHYSSRQAAALRNQLDYLVPGVEQGGLDYCEALTPIGAARITWIAADGTVLYDSGADAATMDNPTSNPEVADALETGVGERTVYGAIGAEKTQVYARRLTDGTVLCLADSQYSLLSLALGMLQPLILVLLIAVALSALLAARVANSLLRPLNAIDLDHPAQTPAYEELAPLLQRIASQKEQINRHMKALRRQQQELETITANMREGLLVIDNQARVLSANPGARRLLEVEDDPIGRSVLTLNRSEAFRAATDAALAGTHSEVLLDLQGRRYQLMANPVYQDGKLRGGVLVLLDVTEQEERDALRREFTANVSHELKTPLTAISGFAEIIRDGIAAPDDIPRFAGNIHQEAARLLTLVNDILHLSQLDENALPTSREAVALLPLLEEIAQRLQPEADKHDVHLAVEATPDAAGGSVAGVRPMLEELFYNLCDNAVKYNRESGQVWVRLSLEEGRPCIRVEDTGVGIPIADRERVFERFYRVNKSHSKEVGGTGLGLSIVKHAAAFHHAAVTLDSEPGHGTTVTVLFKEP